jgi:biotin carboxyl carrier protein
MRLRKYLFALLGTAALAAVLVAGTLTRETWRPWLQTAPPTEPAGADHPAHDEPGRIRLTPQARANLRLVVQPLKLQTYWRTIQVPGAVIEPPGQSDRVITSPVAATVQNIAAVPGDTLRPGDRLFTLRLISEHLQNSQAELYKTAQEVQFTLGKQEQMKDAHRSGAVPEATWKELQNQIDRQNANYRAYHQDLLARGLTPEQIASVAGGRFVRELTLVAPRRNADGRPLAGNGSGETSPSAVDQLALSYEVQELKVQVGEQVQAGQALCTLANHQNLLIEGRAFKQEAPLLEKAAQHGWPIRAEFAEAAGEWPALETPFQIRHFANTMDAVSRTFPFYLPLANHARSFVKDGQTFLVWRFRPGQRVRLDVPAEQLTDVFVLPREAVVREGPEAYLFRQNGDFFERKPVHVLHEDRENVVLANDGSLGVGLHVARNAAAALNRVLKAQATGGGEEHGHDHHHHDH